MSGSWICIVLNASVPIHHMARNRREPQCFVSSRIHNTATAQPKLDYKMNLQVNWLDYLINLVERISLYLGADK
jgi:hypothetical protein